MEVAWRWMFGAAALGMLLFASVRLQHAVAISGEEETMLASMSPDLVMQALGAIAARTLPIATRLAEIIIPWLVLLWVVAASIGRATILSRLLGTTDTEIRWSGFVGLHILRALSVVGLAAAYVLDSMIAAWIVNPEESNYLLTMLMFLVLFMISVLVWSWVHWVLSLAAIYPVRDGTGIWTSVRRALRLVRERWQELAAVASTNGRARILVGVVFTVIGLLPLPLYRVSPGLLIGVEVVISLLYCVVSDWLLLGRLMGYVEAVKASDYSVHGI